jgi:RNA polymerase sigma factor (TIGR02999 family)
MHEIKRTLSAREEGDPRAPEQLLPRVYGELRKLAAQRLAREKPGQTLDATALVHEAYLKLVHAGKNQQWDSTGHFFAAAAKAMRRILVENARRKRRLKRGGSGRRFDLDSAEPVAPETGDELLAVDEALEKLARQDKVKAELVQLRIFAGLTLAQAAAVLGLSTAKADRYWAYARAWLRVEIASLNSTAQAPISGREKTTNE